MTAPFKEVMCPNTQKAYPYLVSYKIFPLYFQKTELDDYESMSSTVPSLSTFAFPTTGNTHFQLSPWCYVLHTSQIQNMKTQAHYYFSSIFPLSIFHLETAGADAVAHAKEPGIEINTDWVPSTSPLDLTRTKDI